MSAVTRLGEQAAQAIRELNHHTRSADAFADPAEMCWLLADLAAAAQRLPQLLAQLNRWLVDEQAATPLRADTDVCPEKLIAAARTALTGAAAYARQLATAVDTAHQHVAQLATA